MYTNYSKVEANYCCQKQLYNIYKKYKQDITNYNSSPTII